MDKIQELMKKPATAIVLLVILVVAIYFSIGKTNQVTHKEERDSIYLTKEEQEDMVKAFANGFSDSGAMGGGAPAAPAAPAGE